MEENIIKEVKRRYGIIGDSVGLTNAIRTALDVATSNCTVLILGESGVGKENIARIIHDYSQRKHFAFVPLNCGAIPEGTIDSALFGHEKGAFTGAADEHKGYFETANKGTIFLDEVGEMPLQTQVRMLRMLESGEFMRVGSSEPKKTDVRIITATNADMFSLVQSKKFRYDLFYRFAVTIYVPPLRERKDDIEKLFLHFASTFAIKSQCEPIRLGAGTLKAMQDYFWPGNIRQLLHVVESMTILEREREIAPAVFQKYVGNSPRVECTGLVLAGSETVEQHQYKHEGLLKVVMELKSQIDDLRQQVELLTAASNHWNVKGLPQPAESVSPAGTILPPPDAEEVEADEVSDEEANEKELITDTLEAENGKWDVRANEKELILKALEATNGRRRAAAELLKMNERTLYRKITKYGL